MPFLKELFRKQDTPKNAGLERAMQKVAANDNAVTRDSLYRIILASTFILQGNVSGGTEVREGQRIADDNTPIAFKTIEHPPGNIVLPVFTTVEALTSWAGSDVQWVALRAQALFQSVALGNIAEVRVNPFRPEQSISRPGGIITRNEFIALAQGLLPESRVSNNTAKLKVASGQKLLIGKPAKELPIEVVRKLIDYFRQVSELRAVYLFQMANKNVTSTVIGLHFAAEPPAQQLEHIMQGVGNVIRGE